MAKVMEVAKTAVSRQEAAAASLTPTSTPGLDLPTNPENATGRTAATTLEESNTSLGVPDNAGRAVIVCRPTGSTPSRG